MIVRWDRVAALALAVCALWIWRDHAGPVRGFLGSMRDIGPGHTAEEKTIGLVAFGLVGTCLVAIVKILTQNRGK
jgi:hypothetical protein